MLRLLDRCRWSVAPVRSVVARVSSVVAPPRRFTQNLCAVSPRVNDCRGMSTSKLSHIDATQNQPAMVDITGKAATTREATARAVMYLPAAVARLFAAAASTTTNGQSTGSGGGDISSAKGPVMSTAIVAGTMAVKSTSQLIPFCHPLPIDGIKFSYSFAPTPTTAAATTAPTAAQGIESGSGHLTIECRVRVTHKTGVEMEALTGASVCALTVYDMCKALTHDMRYSVELISKTGGKSDHHRK